MTMTDPIADFLTRLRNANSAYHDEVVLPHSKLKAHIADTQGARDTMVALSREKSPLAYGAAVVTAVLLGLFGYIIVANPALDEGIKETIKVLTVAAVSYWVGSSRGSAAKDTPLLSKDAPGR